MHKIVILNILRIILTDKRHFQAQEGIESGKLRSDINIEVLILILDKATKGILEYNFLKENNLSINRALKEIEKLLHNGVLSK